MINGIINSIISGISSAIAEEFGEDYEIYTDTAIQGLKEPCFFVFCEDYSLNRFLGKRYKLNARFIVHFLPVTNTSNKKVNYIAERLYKCLEIVIAMDKQLLSIGHNAQIENGILNFKLNFCEYIYLKNESDIKIDSYKLSSNITEVKYGK